MSRAVGTVVLSFGIQLALAQSARAGNDKTANAGAQTTGTQTKPDPDGPQSATGGDPRAGSDARAAYAEHLFQEGLLLMKSDKCPQAVLKFQGSEQIDPNAATLMNLASCLGRLGRTASAWRTYQEAAALAAKEGREDLREEAFNAIAFLAPSLTRLKVIPPRDTAGMALTLNGEPLGDDDGLPIALDPGENIVEATIAGRPPWRRTVNANELGATIVIEVPETAVGKDDEHGTWSKWHVAATVIGGVGVAAIVTGVVLGVNAKNTHDEASQYCGNAGCSEKGLSLWNEANSKATAATYSIGIGALLAATGIGLWLGAPSGSKHAVQVTPWISEQRFTLGVVAHGDL